MNQPDDCPLRITTVLRGMVQTAIIAATLAGCGESNTQPNPHRQAAPGPSNNAVSDMTEDRSPRSRSTQPHIIPADSTLSQSIDDIRQIPEPTPEQLTAWTPPDHAPLELLSIREAPTTDFVIPHPQVHAKMGRNGG